MRNYPRNTGLQIERNTALIRATIREIWDFYREKYGTDRESVCIDRAKMFRDGLADIGVEVQMAMIIKQRKEAGVVASMDLVGSVDGPSLWYYGIIPWYYTMVIYHGIILWYYTMVFGPTWYNTIVRRSDVELSGFVSGCNDRDNYLPH
eukprot:SAG31_NODE_1819_length_7201_cov_9.661504_7_plen_149_part_00